MFKEMGSQVDFPKLEKNILKFWEEHRIFEKSVESRDPKKPFVFYEGPPTANGRPGIHHVISRTIKDFVCRYKTMQGYRVERKAGWDTHGLPVEIEVEKELGIEGKDQLIKYGIDKFNQKCKESVFRYKKEWDEMTRRIGFWVDLEHPYITYENEYIETVWWILKEFWKKELIYQGFKILPYCPRCETPLSSHEVAQGYEDVEDPSVYVKIKVVGEENTYFFVWTTTPWTLISNVALAFHPDMEYVKILHRGEFLILLKDRLEVIDGDYEIVDKFKGRDLAGKEYEPLFKFCKVDKKAFYVVLGDFVSAEEGTGIVHIATAFGEDDYQLGLKYDLPVLQPVDKSGNFTDEVTQFRGKFVKAADPEIIADLRQRGVLYKDEMIVHTYPHCWRCKSPLLYYAHKSWYIKTTAFKDRLIENNRKIKWYPKEVGEGRFGEWLENNVDWALSRDRFWGTPLNIWICETCGTQDCIGSIQEMKERSGLKEDIDLHKPFIDKVYFPCPKCGGNMKRTPEVIDCWFDSGSMPYAQWHYPFENVEKFKQNFPADFISEGVDQTRGWFYSLLVSAAFLFDQPCYKTCLSIELILDKEGQKMSKSRGNTVDPFEILDKQGADALRWYLLTVSPPWVPTRFDPEGVTEVLRKFFGTLINVYSFFALYANIDGFNGSEPQVPISQRPEIDRWIMSLLHTLIQNVQNYLERYDLTKATRAISNFVIDDLSNWYVRRCRRRFWKSDNGENGKMGKDKLSAYQTLSHVLLTVCKLIAPVSPFLAEGIYQNLLSLEQTSAESVHLCRYPEVGHDLYEYRDEDLENRMEEARRVVAFGRSLRNQSGIKIRQPLNNLIVCLKDERRRNYIRSLEELIRDELNVKKITYIEDSSSLVQKKAEPVFKSIGPKFGKWVNVAAETIRSFGEQELSRLEKEGKELVVIDGREMTITRDDVEIVTENLEGLIVESVEDLTVALDTKISDSLLAEGRAREFVNRVQNMRKEAGFQVVDRIRIFYQAADNIKQAVQLQAEYIKNETLAEEISSDSGRGEYYQEWNIDGEKVAIGIERIVKV